MSKCHGRYRVIILTITGLLTGLIFLCKSPINRSYAYLIPTMTFNSSYPAPNSQAVKNNFDKPATLAAYPAPPEFVKPTPDLSGFTPEEVAAVNSSGQVVNYSDAMVRYQDKIFLSASGISMILPQKPTSALGSFQPYRIIGTDDRHQVTDTNQWPWSAVVLIKIYWHSGDQVPGTCTGFLIGNSAVATAGHCIFEGIYPDHAVIVPGANSASTNPEPFGACTSIDYVVFNNWVQKRDMNYDYGVYRLGCKVGLKTGNLGFKILPGDLTNLPVELTGYPADKPSNTMWSGFGNVTSSTNQGLYYDVDMYHGQSGSPVWDYSDIQCDNCAVAINNSEFAPPVMNFGSRIESQLFNLLLNERYFSPRQIFLPISMNY